MAMIMAESRKGLTTYGLLQKWLLKGEKYAPFWPCDD